MDAPLLSMRQLPSSSPPPPPPPLDALWWLPCRRNRREIPTNAQTVQNLISLLDGLAMQKMRANADYEKKAAQVASLAGQGYQRQAWESMQTAKQHKKRWERCHAMQETIEQIKSRIVEQQQNAVLFSSFSEANTALARMIEATPLESIDTLLDTLNERMTDTREASEALARDVGPISDPDEHADELAVFLQQTKAVPPTTSQSTPVIPTPQTVAATTTVHYQRPATLKMQTE
jgi:hypothetical protein